MKKLSKRSELIASLLPIIVLIGIIAGVILTRGAGEVSTIGPWALLVAAAVALLVSWLTGGYYRRYVKAGVMRSCSELLPALPVLGLIGLVSTTWMLSGIVPVMIDYGINILNADLFLPITCAVCSVVSVLLGSSWTTIATVGVAFMGIGHVLGYHEGWVAGAIISGAYFGDKVSPLSDTTVLASSSCGVDLFAHIRNLMYTSMPAMFIALIVFSIAGLNHENHPVSHVGEITDGLHTLFNLTPWLMVVPLCTIILCVMRMSSIKVLTISAAMGLVAMFVAQPGIIEIISADGLVRGTAMMLLTSTELTTGSDLLDNLTATGGLAGMLPTIFLVMAAMIFGGVLIGTGMLRTITEAITARLRRSSSLVTATTGTGLMLNSFTGDQYLSIIIGSNIYRRAYQRSGLEAKLLSRTLEDSVSVTSVLIPWNSCGITQSTVLGVATLTYLPYCLFNYLSPVLTLVWAHIGAFVSNRRRAMALTPD